MPRTLDDLPMIDRSYLSAITGGLEQLWDAAHPPGIAVAHPGPEPLPGQRDWRIGSGRDRDTEFQRRCPNDYAAERVGSPMLRSPL